MKQLIIILRKSRNVRCGSI